MRPRKAVVIGFAGGPAGGCWAERAAGTTGASRVRRAFITVLREMGQRLMWDHAPGISIPQQTAETRHRAPPYGIPIGQALLPETRARPIVVLEPHRTPHA